jgi:hypothetical protein
MAEPQRHSDEARSTILNNIERSRMAMTNYFQFFEKSMSALPIGANDRTKSFIQDMERNVARSFDLADKIMHSEEFSDVVRIQTEFLETQCQILTEEAKDLVKAANDGEDVRGIVETVTQALNVAAS